MAGVKCNGGEITRIVVADEKDIPKGTRLSGGFSANVLLELSSLAIRRGGD
jgi:hypothetical protein